MVFFFWVGGGCFGRRRGVFGRCLWSGEVSSGGGRGSSGEGVSSGGRGCLQGGGGVFREEEEVSSVEEGGGVFREVSFGGVFWGCLWKVSGGCLAISDVAPLEDVVSCHVEDGNR